MSKIYVINEHYQVAPLNVLKETKKTFLVEESIKYNKTVVHKEKDLVFKTSKEAKLAAIDNLKNIIFETKKTLREADSALKFLLRG